MQCLALPVHSKLPACRTTYFPSFLRSVLDGTFLNLLQRDRRNQGFFFLTLLVTGTFCTNAINDRGIKIFTLFFQCQLAISSDLTPMSKVKVFEFISLELCTSSEESTAGCEWFQQVSMLTQSLCMNIFP
jgi:hypothetical protein